MKLALIATLLSVILAVGSAHAQALNGNYAGFAQGIDVHGNLHHQLTNWIFNAGKLVSFQEIITYSGTDVAACAFIPDSSYNSAPFKYTTFTTQNFLPNNNAAFVVVAFGCPAGSANRRLDAIEVIPDTQGTGFSYLEFNPSYPTLPAETAFSHFSGHAKKQ